MPRRFYLSLQPNPQESDEDQQSPRIGKRVWLRLVEAKSGARKAETPLKHRVKLMLSILGLVGVGVLMWLYFADDDRWPTSSAGLTTLEGGGETQSSATQTPLPVGGLQSTIGTGEMAAESGLAAVDHPVRLEVQNGCHKRGLAALAAQSLRARSTFFDVRAMTDGGPDTLVISRVMSRTADSTLAMAVADSLGIDRARVSTEIPRHPRDVDVTIMLGLDYRQLKLNWKPDSKE